MNRDDFKRKMKQFEGKLDTLLREHDQPAPPLRATRTTRTRRTPGPRAGSAGNQYSPLVTKPLESLLLTFTPESAFAFLFERTVPPANEDGLALIAAYPELRVAAPELVEDLAFGFRQKSRDQYADHFARIAKFYGIKR